MAADNSLAMKQLHDIGVCSICLQTFTDPRMLPCVHTFCLRCLQKTAKKTDKKPGVQMPCPLCRKEFTIPDNGLQRLQKNFLMEVLIEVTTAFDNSQSPHSDGVCTTNVDAGGNIASAKTRCFKCRGKSNLCDDCVKRYSSKDHPVADIGREVGMEEPRAVLTCTNCEIHRQKPLEVYCADCKKVVCVSCLCESHKTHDWKDVSTVEEEFCQLISSKVTKMNRFISELSRRKNNLEKREDFLEKIEVLEKGILMRNKKLKALIDRHTESLLETLTSIKSEHLKKLQIEEDELDWRKTVLNSFGKYCAEIRSNGSATDVCRRKDEVLQRAEELEEEHEAFAMRPGLSSDVIFSPFNIVDVLKRDNSNIIGELKEAVLQRNNYLIVNGSGESDGFTMANDFFRVSLTQPHEIRSLQEIPTKTNAGSAAAVYNDVIFVTGVGDNCKDIWKYSVSSAWIKCGSMLQDRWWHCAEFVGEQLLIMGGCPYLPGRDTTLKSIEAFSVVRNQCETVGLLKHGVKVAACTAYQDSVFLFGGMTDRDKDLDCVQVYSTLTKSVTVLSTRMPRPSRLMCAVVCGRHIILMGQYTCFLFNVEEETWEERNQFKTDVSYFGLVLQNERIFLFGGGSSADDKGTWKCSDELKYVRVLDVFKDEVASWKIAANLPKSVHVHAYGIVAITKCL